MGPLFIFHQHDGRPIAVNLIQVQAVRPIPENVGRGADIVLHDGLTYSVIETFLEVVEAINKSLS